MKKAIKYRNIFQIGMPGISPGQRDRGCRMRAEWWCCSFVLVVFILVHGFNIAVEFKVQNEKWKINLRANPKLKLRTWIKRKTWSPFISGFSLYDLLLVIYFELPLSSDHYQQFWFEWSLLHLHNANQVHCWISQSDGEKGLLDILQAIPGSA